MNVSRPLFDEPQFSAASHPKSVVAMAAPFAPQRGDSSICFCCFARTDEYKVLPCLHTLCKLCLAQLSAGGERPFACPRCNQEVPSDEESLDGIASNALPSTVYDVVNGGYEANGGRGDEHLLQQGTMCKSCNEETRAIARCEECIEVLCNKCLRAHQRVRLTRDHMIVSLREETAMPPFHVFCDKHQGSEALLYCNTCSETLCSQCMKPHRDQRHSIDCLQDALQGSKSTCLHLMKDAKAALEGIKDNIELVQHMSKRIEIRARAVTSDVKTVMHRHMSAMQEREQALLARVDQIREIKGRSLQLQVEGFQQAYAKLSHLVEYVQNVVNSGSSYDILKAKDKFLAYLQEVRRYSCRMQPYEDDNIHFTPPDSALLTAIASVGFVTSSGYAPNTVAVGDGLRWAPCNRPTPVTVYVKDHANESCLVGGDPIQAVLQGPDGRASPVEVSDRNNGSYVLTYKSNKEGRHLLSVMLRGFHVKDSPFKIMIRKGRDYSKVGKSIMAIGEEGEEVGQFCRPWGVCTDKEGHIIVADRSNNRIQVFYPNGTFKHKFGSPGNHCGEFDRPAGVTTNFQNHIIVADKDNHRIQVFTFEGQFLLTFGERGSKNGQFNYPWDVAVNAEGKILVTDTRNHRIQLFKPDGTFVAKYGWDGCVFKNLDSPRGVCFTADGYVLLTDFNHHRIVVLTPELRAVRYIGTEGSHTGQLLRPQGIAVDVEGNIVVADSRNHRIQVFNPAGGFVCKFGSAGKEKNQMDRPSGVAVSPEGHILVIDFGNHRLQVF